MRKFPLAHIVEVDVNSNRLNLFDIRSNDIRIPDRTEEDFVKCRIMRYDFYSGLAGVCLNIDLADHRGIVALVIADREFDMVNAVCKSDIGNRHHAVLVCAGGFNTVDICFCRGGIQTGVVALFRVVCNLNTKRENIFGNSLTIQDYCIGHARCCISHITEDRCFAVVNRIGIVNCDIVNIHDISAVVRLVLIIPVIIIRTITVGNVELNDVVISKQIQAFIGAQIDGEVMPARFLILVHKAGCGSDTISQSVCNCTTCFDVFAVIVELEREYGVADPCGNVFVRDVDPHAKFGSIFKLLLFAQVCQRGHHVAGFQRIAVVNIERHSAVTTVNLAGFCGYGIYLAFRQYIVVCTISEFKVAHVSVFKVIYNLRAFAESDV